MPPRFRNSALLASALFAMATTTGCYSPFAADRGALLGGVTGAGVGALVGNAVGNTAAGALIGGGVGAVTGGAIGQGLDEVDARNRAAVASIEAQMHRPVPPGAVSIDDVVSMTKAGVNDDLITGHIRARGMARPLSAQDIILLQQQGVSPLAIQAMQSTPPVAPQMAGPPPGTAPGPYYPPPYYYPYPPPPPVYYYPPPPPPPMVGWGVSFR